MHISLLENRGWMEGWMGGWMDGWMDEWMDGWTGKFCLLVRVGEILALG